MTPDLLKRGARALMKAQDGTDDFDALEPDMQADLMSHVRAVIEAVDMVEIPRIDLNRPASEQGVGSTDRGALFERMKKIAVEILQMNDSGALHIFVADGNCEDESLEFCLEQEHITDAEREFVERMLLMPEEWRFGAYAFTDCRDIMAEAGCAPQ